jgi:hypothetical protein
VSGGLLDRLSFCSLSRYAAALALAGLLAACETAPEEAPLVAETAPEPELETPADGVDVGELASDPAEGLFIETGAAVPEIAALPPEPPPPPEPVIDDDPQQLYGLDSTALDELLGQPSLIRTEAPAQIWQYRSQTCVFDIFLYEEAGASRVTYIEARDGAAAQIEARYCLNELLRARMGLPLG